jgi:hypothetical protein
LVVGEKFSDHFEEARCEGESASGFFHASAARFSLNGQWGGHEAAIFIWRTRVYQLGNWYTLLM